VRGFIAFSVLAVCLAGPAVAQTWESETGQGNTDAKIATGEATLRVLCTLNGRVGVNALNLTVQGQTASGPVTFQTGRRAPITVPFVAGLYTVSNVEMLETFTSLIDRLRRSNNATATVNGQTVSIPLRGSSAALVNCPVRVSDVENPDLGVRPVTEPEPTPDSAPDPTPAAPEPEASVAPAAPSPPPIPANPILAVEEALAKLGYFPGAMDGQIDDALHVAIATWQRDTGREVTGALMMEDFQALQADAAQN